MVAAPYRHKKPLSNLPAEAVQPKGAVLPQMLVAVEQGINPWEEDVFSHPEFRRGTLTAQAAASRPAMLRLPL